MANNAVLTGSVSIELDTTHLTALGQFVTDDGFNQSESVDLTSFITPQVKATVQSLLAELQQQYKAVRQNTLPQSKCFLSDMSFLSPLLNAGVVADTTMAFAGTQSAKIVTPGNAQNEGTSINLGSVKKNSNVTVTLTMIIPTNATIQFSLEDTVNTVDVYEPVSPPTTPPTYTKTSTPISSVQNVQGTGNWQTISTTITSGSTNTPQITLLVTTILPVQVTLWIGAVQLVSS